MAMVKNTRNVYCDDVFTELSGLKDKVTAMRDRLAAAHPAEGDIYRMFDRHIGEIANLIDWKLQILAHTCSYDWKGSSEEEFEENTVSVGPVDAASTNMAGGYLGG